MLSPGYRRSSAGIPPGVCLLQEWPEASLMQRIAAENNLAETAFVVIRGAESADKSTEYRGGYRGALCDLRWFTPAVEIDLCGHATLAAAHVLFTWGGWSGASVTFSSLSGPLTVEHRGDKSMEYPGEMLVMDFPARPALPCDAFTGAPERTRQGARGSAGGPRLPRPVCLGGGRARPAA